MDNKFKIILKLGKNPDKKLTMRELSIGTAVPYATFYRTADSMDDLIVKEKIGHSYIVKLNQNNKINTSYLAIASDEEKKEFLAKKPIIKKIENEIQTDDIVLLFGSYAKGKETKISDIDLLIINKLGKKSVSFSKYELLFDKKINPIFVSEIEFKEMMMSTQENVGKQALKNHIILNNPQKFWELMQYGI
ncbi:MAG: nucleotidyltransferase domain-containing protein [Nanoarchaeota archaeon]|nr:nucleotidyltransferase domain-containing protein [Nanoarchaeota archaeon]